MRLHKAVSQQQLRNKGAHSEQQPVMRPISQQLTWCFILKCPPGAEAARWTSPTQSSSQQPAETKYHQQQPRRASQSSSQQQAGNKVLTSSTDASPQAAVNSSPETKCSPKQQPVTSLTQSSNHQPAETQYSLKSSSPDEPHTESSNQQPAETVRSLKAAAQIEPTQCSSQQPAETKCSLKSSSPDASHCQQPRQSAHQSSSL
jgi:hypothetical protein